MQLNSQKTMVSNEVVMDSVKPDKLYWYKSKKWAKSLKENLLLIHSLSEYYPNSGSLNKSLTNFYKRVYKKEEITENIKVLSSIISDIMLKNPRTYPIATAILSKFLSLVGSDEIRQEILEKIEEKFNKIPNTGHLKIWFQRLTIKINRLREYEEDLCKRVNDLNTAIWNTEWLNQELSDIINNTPIIDEDVIDEIDEVINNEEVELFKQQYNTDEVVEEPTGE
jgi:hypothetical protein